MKTLSKVDLSPDQLNALNQMCDWYHSPQSKSHPFVLTGAAGTGKTSILPVMIKQLKLKTLNMIGLATSAIASKNIGDKTGIVDVRTIAGFLKAPQPQLLVHRGKKVLAYTSVDMLANVIDKWEKKLSTAEINSVNQILNQALRLKLKKQNKSSFHPTSSTEQLMQLQALDVNQLNRIFKQPRMFELSTSFIDRDDSFNDKAIERLQGLDLIIVDELSMIPESDIEMVLSVASLAKVPVIMIGDPFQLPPVKAKPSDLLDNAQYPFHVTLLKLHRQSNAIATLGAYLRPPYNYNIKNALYTNSENTNHQITEISVAYPNQINEMQSKHPNAVVDLLNSMDMVLARTNRQVRALTDSMRQRKYNLSADQALTDGVKVGDAIRISMNEFMSVKADQVIQPNERFMNGVLGHVEHVYNDTRIINQIKKFDPKSAEIYRKLHLKCVDLKLEDGRLRKHLFINTLHIHEPNVNASTLYDGQLYNINNMVHKAPFFYQWFNENVLQYELSPFFDPKFHHMSILYITYGYVLTVYKSQGREWDKVLYVAQGPMGTTEMRRKLNYTAITRAKQQLVLFLYDLE